MFYQKGRLQVEDFLFLWSYCMQQTLFFRSEVQNKVSKCNVVKRHWIKCEKMCILDLNLPHTWYATQGQSFNPGEFSHLLYLYLAQNPPIIPHLKVKSVLRST